MWLLNRVMLSIWSVTTLCACVETAQAPVSHAEAAQFFSSPEVKEVWVEHGEDRFFCRMIGQGPPLVVLHGGPGLSQNYLLPHLYQLAQSHTVLFYDQRGSGASSAKISAETMRIPVFVDDLEAIRASFGWGKISILGHSWGGFLALHYALEHPESVDRLVLANSFCASSDGVRLYLQEWYRRMAPFQEEFAQIQQDPRLLAGDPEIAERSVHLILRTYCHDPAHVEHLDLRFSPQAALQAQQSAELLRQQLLLEYSLYDSLKALSIPTLIIHGDADSVPLSTAEELHQSLPQSRFVLLENCGHFPYVEAPEAFFDAVRIFLATEAPALKSTGATSKVQSAANSAALT